MHARLRWALGRPQPTRVRLRERGARRGVPTRSPDDQRPSTANQPAPAGFVTNTIGAKHGDGRSSVVSNSASPPGSVPAATVTGNARGRHVDRLVGSIEARHGDPIVAIVFLPVFGPEAKTRSLNSTSTLPDDLTETSDSPTAQAAPAPLMPRIGARTSGHRGRYADQHVGLDPSRRLGRRPSP